MFALILIAALTQTPSPSGASLSQGRTYLKWLRAGDDSRLLKSATRELTPRQVSQFSAQVQAFGKESRVIAESLNATNQLTRYRRVMAVSRYARGAEIEITMDATGRLVNVTTSLANQNAPTIAGAYRSLVPLRLPLEGEWYVLWGGRTWGENRHASVSDMRYALDLFIPKNGKTFTGSGTRNEDYWAWKQPVLAPGAGTVVVAVDGVKDNQPKHAMPGNLYGNFVVIDHGTGEFSLLAHLQEGSVRVKVGETISQGQPIGRTGNSGMSTEPHVHYHLMDNGDWTKAQGLPAQFLSFTRNGTLVERGEPRRGEFIANSTFEARR